ncbi:MAG TPA: protein kinase [Longimicrobiales bacterium]|nr:protein kinase [Longimicrobiales bacterium]
MITPDPRLATALAGHYRLERELGSGGMATVWLARDLKHDRDVALKVLRPELAASLGTERFLAEIRTTAKLQHANIVPLFDSGEAGGFLYYVMPCIEGESLRPRLDREKRLDVDAMLAIAHPVAQALAYAHGRGVVHRDVKPENILLSGGQPFVTDFGIARAVSAAGAERLTRTGIGIGTPAYMSPEQAFGEPTVDARSDIYSLGCVIYEMLAGAPPFTGSTVEALLARRLMGPPPHLTNVPAPVDDVVRKSLATAPQDRFATAIALADALVEAARRPATPELSIVVLPFQNLSPDPDNAFFADGLTEELIAALSKVRALRVISRTTAMLLKGSQKDVPAIARELNVRYVLEGSVRRAGNSLRITAQLIDAQTDAHLWADVYAGTLEDVFGIQEGVARAIAKALAVTLDASTSAKLAERPIENVAAYECYLRAIQSMWLFTAPGLTRAVEHLERALSIEGESAQLHAALSYVYYQHANIGMEPYDEYRRKARQQAEKALALSPENALAHVALGVLEIFSNPIGKGIPALKRALITDPSNVEALLWLALFVGQIWRPEEGRRYLERMRRVDPLHPLAQWTEAYLHMHGGQFERAERVLREALRGNKDLLGRWLLGQVLAHQGKRDEACVLFDEIAKEEPGNIVARIGTATRHALAGDKDRALAVLRSDLDVCRLTQEDFGYAYWTADCHALAGDAAGTSEWLERAVSLGMVNYPYISQYDTFLTPMRLETWFQELLVRVRHAWEAVDV